MHFVLLALFIYWMLLFAACRAIFLFYNLHVLMPSPHRTSDVVRCFWQSFSLDASMAAYLLVIPWLLLAFLGSRPRYRTGLVLKSYVLLMTVLYSLVAVTEAFIYPEWKQKLNARILTTLAHPSEIMRTVPWDSLLLGFAVWLSLSFVAFFLFRIFYASFLEHKARYSVKTVLLALSWPIILGVTARGGTKAIAIDVSRVYFSKDPALNDAAINPGNYFLRNVMQSRLHMFGTNIFETMPKEEANRLKHMLVDRDTGPITKIIKDGPVNLVFIVLESWSADLVASLGGLPEIAPNFARLEKEGLLFTQFFANGNRSQQGIASIFGAFPALPRSTITEDPAKARKLPGLAKKLSLQGYETSFLYGGQLEYGNIKSFIVDSGFQTILEDKDFSSSLARANLGVPDGEMFRIFHDHLNQQKQPFFASYFTLSSHAPYDVPDPSRYHFSGLEAPFVKSAMYTDEELGHFFDAVRQEPWFDRTLFVVVADHSHNTYLNRSSHDPGYRRIPCLLTGGALRSEFRGKIWDHIGSQVDLVATVLHQIGLSSQEFVWSKDLLAAKNHEFAYYEIGDGVGWVTREGAMVYDFEEKEIRQSTYAPLEEITAKRHALAYLQVLFQMFVDL